MRRRYLLLVVVGLSLIAGCGAEDAFPSADELDAIRALYNPQTSQVAPGVYVPATPDTTDRFADDAAARDLGQKLFNDKGISGCGTVSCATCHPAPGYTVSTAGGPGCNGITPHNPPTVLNAAFASWFMWDGRKDSLWDQVSGPLLNPVEMNATPASLKSYLGANYASEYQTVFGVKPQDEADADEVVANFGKAIEAYERTLIRVKAPFDEKVQHFIVSAEQGQQTEDPFYEQMHAYVRRGRCIVCHKGPTLSDGKFHDLGLDEPSGDPDHGRQGGIPQLLADSWNGGGTYSDDPAAGNLHLSAMQADTDPTDGAFKTATLRNVELTGPYMHNGSLATLDDVIEFYNRGGDRAGFSGVRTNTIIPLYLSDTEKAALKDLLLSLTGSENP